MILILDYAGGLVNIFWKMYLAKLKLILFKM